MLTPDIAANDAPEALGITEGGEGERRGALSSAKSWNRSTIHRHKKRKHMNWRSRQELCVLLVGEKMATNPFRKRLAARLQV